jgi:hypothetical protein
MIIASAASFETAQLYAEFCNNPSVSFFYFGIGCLEAARRESKFLSIAEGKEVWVVGTCGSWKPFSGVELITTDRILWLPVCERMGLAESIEEIEPPIFVSSMDSVSMLPSYTLLCGPTIASSSVIHSQIQNKYQLEDARLAENIECYVFAKNLLRVAKKVNFLLAITNQVGPDGRRQWRENFREAAEKSSEFIRAHIS